MREAAVRLGLFTGVFTGGFNYIHCMLGKYLGQTGWNSFIAGSLSGLSVLFMSVDTRRTLSLYIMIRAAQCIYNELKRRGSIKPIPHGDSWLFILSSAQVMYSYVMRPDSLPPSYFKFIRNTGPIHATVL